MDAIFFVLLWIAIPAGGFSEIFGAQADCEAARVEVAAKPDVMYASECAEVKMHFLRQVRHEYQRPNEIKGM